jgi:hypothetical protein
MKLKNLLDRSFGKVKALRSYRCVMHLYSWKKGKERAKQRLLYRAPGDVRIEQLGPFRKGAVVVIRSNGKITARGGGLLSSIKMEMQRDSRLLKGITGDSAVESDWASIFSKFNRMLPSVVRWEAKTIRVHSLPAYDVITHLRGQPWEKARIIVRQDGPILLLERFQKKRLESRIEWKDIEINIDVADADFKL